MNSTWVARVSHSYRRYKELKLTSAPNLCGYAPDNWLSLELDIGDQRMTCGYPLPGNQTQVIGLGSQCLYPLWHLSSLCAYVLKEAFYKYNAELVWREVDVGSEGAYILAEMANEGWEALGAIQSDWPDWTGSKQAQVYWCISRVRFTHPRAWGHSRDQSRMILIVPGKGKGDNVRQELALSI